MKQKILLGICLILFGMPVIGQGQTSVKESLRTEEKYDNDGHRIFSKAEPLNFLNRKGNYIRLANGSIFSAFNNTATCGVSTDEGITWTDYFLFDSAKYSMFAPAVVQTRKGTIIVGFSNMKELVPLNWDADTHCYDPNAKLPTYITYSKDNGKTWSTPLKLHDEWTGNNRAIVETKDGHVVLSTMIMRNNPGRHCVLTYVSSDDGATWMPSNILDSTSSAGHHAGLMEAAIIQLNDGRLWMLIRTNWDYFYESFSSDNGLTWSAYQKTNIDASSSPGALIRLQSGRLVLAWNRLYHEGKNEITRRGGDKNLCEVATSWQRDELSLMYSDDDGKTWSTPIIVAGNKTPPVSGTNTGYPLLFEQSKGVIWIFSMEQSTLRIAIREDDLYVNPISIQSEILAPMQEENRCVGISEKYTDFDGFRRERTETTTAQSDFAETCRVCYSDDNGRTWGPWKDVYAETFERIGDKGQHERMFYDFNADIYNPVHRHYVSVGMERIFANGHEEAYRKYWSGEVGFCDHSYLCVRKVGSDVSTPYLIKYEEGSEYDPANPLDENYFLKNNSYFGKPYVMKNGDVIFAVGPPVITCCRMLGIDAQEIFPSNPYVHHGLIIGRGRWNGEKYDLTFSRPVVISDLKSSRGVDEPLIAELNSGRILVVFRGSNVQTKNWNTRIEPGTPGHKWYCYSDDGGKTFTDPVPWHFDNGEVIYSSATISYFLRATKNGKLYWFGNITDHNVNGNYPRYPLQLVEIDETYGTAKRNTLTVIDTRREGESEFLQLSNFALLDDRETGDIECYLTKIGILGNTQVWRAPAVRYKIYLK